MMDAAGVDSLLNARKSNYLDRIPPNPSRKPRRDAISNLHIYWTKKPYVLVQDYISALSRPGDVVLDPFCGAGSTAIAALSTGRKFIGGDLSYAAAFITKSTLECVAVETLQEAFRVLKDRVQREIDSLYLTPCRECDQTVPANFFRWTKTYACTCGAEVPLVQRDQNNPSKLFQKQKKYSCPSCGNAIKLKKSAILEEFPFQVHYSCPYCKARNKLEPLVSRDLEVIDQARQRIERSELSFARIRLVHNSQIGIVQPDAILADMYTPRNWLALEILWEGLQDLKKGITPPQEVINALFLTFTSVLYNTSKMAQDNDKGGGIAIKGTLYRPPFFRERNVWRSFEYKFKRHIIPGKAQIAGILEPRENIAYQIFQRDARDYSMLPDNSIDYIFTDPPYGDAVPYFEINALMTPWLGEQDDYTREIVVSKSPEREKTNEQWETDIREAFAELFRVLKEGRWLTVTFYDKDAMVWRNFQAALHNVGFQPAESVVAMSGLHKTYKQHVSRSTVGGNEIVANFVKPLG